MSLNIYTKTFIKMSIIVGEQQMTITAKAIFSPL